MCGICGIVTPHGASRVASKDRVLRMRDTMVHRGPDDAGVWAGPNVALGHRRLSIVDVEGGHQPMATSDGRYHLVYNGEVYNHPSLMQDLKAAGEVYRTHCDTETLLLLFAREGLKAVHRLRGMFAFGLWDATERRLVLVRDRLGIKPLYYVHAPDGTLFFASEIKALVAGEAVRPALNLSVLPDYLANHAPSGDETLFQGVRRLPPGHVMTWKDGQIQIQRFWRLSFEKEAPPRKEEDLIEEFVHRFRESIRLRLMADVPLGAFLSGGIDSTAITAVMSEMVEEPVRTFSVAFSEREANELEFARMAAEAFGTHHREVVVSPEEFFRALPRMVWHEDEPIAHPSSVALYFVAALSAEDVKVVLTGEGSDELLAGYARYWKTVLNLRAGGAYHRFVPSLLRRTVERGLAASASRAELARKLTRTFLALPPDMRSLYFDNFAVFSTSRQRKLLTEEAQARTNGTDPHAVLETLFARSQAGDLLDRMLDVDIQVYLQELLMKQDQMSMAASVESRVPFLDHELVEFAAALPVEMKLRGRTTKYVLRRSLEGTLPREILRRPKAGFPVPISRWLKTGFRGLVDEYILGERATRRGLFRREALEALVGEHDTGQDDHGQRLWSLINLEIWQRLFLDGEPLETGFQTTPGPER
jgi:asparagine synthase (glutamine-hydrolysing)